MMTMIFVISPCTTHAQEDQCFPGLEQIPPVADSDASTTSNFVGQGGRIYGVQITVQQTGTLIGLALIRASTQASAKIALYADNNDSPAGILTNVAPEVAVLPNIPQGFGSSPRVDTNFVYLSAPITITEPSTKLWVCVKFAGSTIRLLRQFPDAEGLRFTATSPWDDEFPEDLTNIGSVNVQPGLYGTYLIMENCEDPPAPVEGCTDENAFNFNPNATIDDGSCIFPILGCTNEEAFNFNPDAELDDGSCVLEITCSDVPLCLRTDANQDETVTVIDILIFLAMFGTSPQELETSDWCTGILLDLNNDGVLNAADLGIFLTCFGLDLSDDWEAFWESLE